MRVEFMLLLVTGAVVANIYTEGQFFRKVMSYRKYYEMASVLGLGLFMYYVVKKNPCDSKKLIMSTNEYIKYLPIDKNAADIISPILNFSASAPSAYGLDGEHDAYSGYGGGGGGYGGGGGGAGDFQAVADASFRSATSATTKRVVSETKKKFVAARQNWRCNECNHQLNAWFEVDHNIRLEHGGTNHVDNLAALCRECHGQKTTLENL